MAKNEHFLPSWNNLLSKRWNVVWTVGHSVFFFERRAMTKMTKKSSLRLSHLSWVVIVNIAYYDQWYYHKLLNLVKNKSLCNRRLSILVIRFFSFSFSIISSQTGEETWLGSSLVVIKSKDKQDALKACNWASTCKKKQKNVKGNERKCQGRGLPEVLRFPLLSHSMFHASRQPFSNRHKGK